MTDPRATTDDAADQVQLPAALRRAAWRTMDERGRRIPATGRTLSVHLASDESFAHVIARGKVLDLSRLGAKFSLDAEVPLDQIVHVRVVNDGDEMMLRLSGKLCWSQSGDDWRRAGMQFVSEVSAEEIEKLSREGYLDRRRWPRQPLLIKAMAQRQFDNTSFPVEVIDVSPEGCCLCSTEVAPNTTQLRLIFTAQADGQAIASVRVRWQSELAAGYVLGCEFADDESFQRLTKILDSREYGLASSTSGRAKTNAKSSKLAYRELIVAVLAILAALGASYSARTLGTAADFLVAVSLVIALAASWEFWRKGSQKEARTQNEHTFGRPST
jgi:hypothetical protein